MYPTIRAKIVFCGLVALSLAACNLPAQSQNASAQSDNQIPTALPGQELCTNTLFPVKKGAVWTYATSSETLGTSTFTSTITDVRADGFTTTTQVGQDSATQEWSCTPDGLLALSFGNGVSVLDFATQGISGNLSASNVSGITIPANIQPGAKWQYNMDVSGNIKQTSNNISANANGKVVTDAQAMGIESITVPAGTFQATKIQATSNFNLITDFFGLGIPFSFSINSTFWLAPGVGLVRSDQDTTIVGTAYSASTALQSYNVP